ncbi:MAG: hypothetical protein GX817_02515 [Elusimicrobia bacterium]|nr:hypothetical protein [Elusimicrobiota bacterium]
MKENRRISIAAPVSRLSEAASLIKSGVNEIYCGILTPENIKNRPDINVINRRAGASSNLPSFDSLEKLVNLAHSKDVKVSFALNEFYGFNQLSEALQQAEVATECGVDNIIIADIGLLRKLSKSLADKVDIHISSVASVFNSATVEFYKRFNPAKIILQRALRMDEFRMLAQENPDTVFEVFLMRERCYFVDGCCGFIHNSYLSQDKAIGRFFKSERLSGLIASLLPNSVLEKILYRGNKNVLPCNFSYSIDESSKSEHLFNSPSNFMNACGLCSMYDFMDMGISNFKISGRSIQIDKIKPIRFIKEAEKLVNAATTKEEYMAEVQKLALSLSVPCSPELCYYSEGEE